MKKLELIELIEQLTVKVNQNKLLEQELMQIFNTAADGMRVIDLNFTTLRVNKTFLQLTNTTLSQNIGHNCYDVFKGEICHSKQCPIVQIKNGKSKLEVEIDKITADGSLVPCIVTATPFSDPEGNLIGVVEDFKDISERKLAEENIKQKNHKLQEANITLKNVLAHIEEEKISIKENINLNIEKTVKPVLQRIKEEAHNRPQLIELLETNLNRLSMDFYHKINNYKLKLSPTEIKVCQLVRAGYQAKEIASLMHIAASTVHVHKEKIRKKLGLTNKPINLKTYLSELLVEETSKQ